MTSAEAPKEVLDRTLAIWETLSKSIDREHGIIAHRMTWLMTLNGFLVAGSVLLLTEINADSPPYRVLNAMLIGLASLGSICNFSVLFSNYWAGRAISGADYAADAWINEIDASNYSPQQDNRSALYDRRSLMRLYGRDPTHLPTQEYHFHVPWSKPLHPWYLLPFVFGLAYLTLPWLTDHTGNNAQGRSSWHDATPILLTLTLFSFFLVPGVVREQRWRLSRPALLAVAVCCTDWAEWSQSRIRLEEAISKTPVGGHGAVAGTNLAAVATRLPHYTRTDALSVPAVSAVEVRLVYRLQARKPGGRLPRYQETTSWVAWLEDIIKAWPGNPSALVVTGRRGRLGGAFCTRHGGYIGVPPCSTETPSGKLTEGNPASDAARAFWRRGDSHAWRAQTFLPPGE